MAEETVSMKMARASDEDMRALLDVVSIIEAVAKGWMPELEAEDDLDGPDDDFFDIDDPDHCRYIVEMLLRAEERGGLFRAAFGLTVLLNPKNELVDPHLDHIAKHPNIINALKLREWMGKRREQGVVVASYAIEDPATHIQITVQRAIQVDGPDLWKVKRGDAHCLNRDGEWEYEPLPSSRDDDFLARCRYATADEAIDAALKAKAAEEIV